MGDIPGRVLEYPAFNSGIFGARLGSISCGLPKKIHINQI